MFEHPACFVTKTVYDDFGYFDLQYISAADYDFMLRMSEIDEVKFYMVDQIITNFTRGGMSLTAAAWLDLLKMRRNHGIISEREYKKEMLKDKIYRIYCKLVKKNID